MTIQDIISKYKQKQLLINQKEQNELTKEIINDLCNHYMYLVTHIEKKYIRYYYSHKEDIHGVALQALVLAATKCQEQGFDESVGKYFAVYIKGHIRCYIRQHIKRNTIELCNIYGVKYSIDSGLICQDIFNRLNEFEKNILRLRLENHSYTDIAEKLSMPYYLVLEYAYHIRKLAKEYL